MYYDVIISISRLQKKYLKGGFILNLKLKITTKIMILLTRIFVFVFEII
jgi:hypothetical protein